jgi:hypothetical protein
MRPFATPEALLAGLPHRNRKITAEAIMAIRRYVEEEAKEGLPLIGEAAG